MRDPEELIARIQAGDREAAEALVEENAGLIWAVARRFQGRGTELEDLYQLGCLGFLKAVEGFDPAFGTRFSTYAVPKIAGEIRRFLRDDGAIKVSRGLKEQSAAVEAGGLLPSGSGKTGCWTEVLPRPDSAENRIYSRHQPGPGVPDRAEGTGHSEGKTGRIVPFVLLAFFSISV